ncbi:MAG: substrate-binding domain-containing protein [Chloroflexota bacterium]|nr:substrate-binding domain-containing protein [Chloroflexota bacterium]
MRTIERFFLLGLVFVLLSCERVLVPLDKQGASLGQGDGGSESVLLRMGVCWPGVPLAKELVAAYVAENPRVSTDIVACDTSAAHDLLSAGQVDLAVVSEAGGCRKDKRSTSMALALDAVVVVVSRQSSLDEITREELSALFGGYYVDWQRLSAGRGQPELVVCQSGATARELFQAVIMEGQTVSSAAMVMPHDRAVLEYVAEHVNAVGYISRAYVDERVKVLAIDGVLPTQEAIREGEYPLVHCLRVEISESAPREASDLLSFMCGREGQHLVAERYVIPD